MIPAVQRNARFSSVGAWRSLVAHLHGVQGVEGSNPSVPTILKGFQRFSQNPFKKF